MTSSARPAAEATAPMAQTPELQPPEPQPPEPQRQQEAPAQAAHPAEPPAPDCPPPAAPAAPAAHRPRRRVAAVEKASSGDRPLVIALVSLIGLLLGLPMYLINDEVNEIEHKVDALEAKIDARFAAQDAKIDARFAAQDAKIDARFAQVDARFAQVDVRFDSLQSGLGEINLKLTALIASLNATEAVGAALEGRLTGAGTADPVDEPR